MKFERFAGIALLLFGLLMLYLGYQMNGLPPAVTGAGFLLIGWVFLRRTWKD